MSQLSSQFPFEAPSATPDAPRSHKRIDFAPDNRTPVVLACLFLLILGIVFGYFSLFHGWGSNMRDPFKRLLMPFIPWLLIGAGVWGLWLVRDPKPVLSIWPGRGLGGRFLQRRIAFRDIERMELRERTTNNTKVVWLELELVDGAPWPGKSRWWHLWLKPEKVQIALNLLKPASRTAAAEAAMEQWTAWRLQQVMDKASHAGEATQSDVIRTELDAMMARDLGMTLPQYQQWMHSMGSGTLSAPASSDTPSADAAKPDGAPAVGAQPGFAPATPWVMYALLAMNVLVWLWMVWRGVPAFNPKVSDLYPWGANSTWAVRGLGEYWRLFAATVLHGGMMHLVLNMLALYSAGRLCNALFGHSRFALIYLGSALAGSALSLHFSASSSVSVGASGAVMGVMGALLAAALRQQRIRTQLGRSALYATPIKLSAQEMAAPLVYMLIVGFVVPHIDNAAHIGGMVAGLIMGWGMYPHSPDKKHDLAHTPNHLLPAPGQVAKRSSSAAASVALCALLTGVLIATANPANSVRTAALLQWQHTIDPLFARTQQTQRRLFSLMQLLKVRQGQPLSQATQANLVQQAQLMLPTVARDLATAQALPHTAAAQPDAISQHMVQWLHMQQTVLQHMADLPERTDQAALAELMQHYQHLESLAQKP